MFRLFSITQYANLKTHRENLQTEDVQILVLFI